MQFLVVLEAVVLAVGEDQQRFESFDVVGEIGVLRLNHGAQERSFVERKQILQLTHQVIELFSFPPRRLAKLLDRAQRLFSRVGLIIHGITPFLDAAAGMTKNPDADRRAGLHVFQDLTQGISGFMPFARRLGSELRDGDAVLFEVLAVILVLLVHAAGAIEHDTQRAFLGGVLGMQVGVCPDGDGGPERTRTFLMHKIRQAVDVDRGRQVNDLAAVKCL